MSSFKNLTGQKFNKLTVIDRTANRVKPSGKQVAMWLCQCDCGKYVTVASGDLKSGHTKSCGCIMKNNKNGVTHGMCHSRAYRSWRNMRDRCFNPKYKSYKDYGGRGITVCEKWLAFEGFWEDMYEGYADNLTLDRIDNDKNYEPGNCRWITNAEQQANKRCNHLIEINGEIKPLATWAKITNIKESTLFNREKAGKRGLDLIKPPRHKSDSKGRAVEV
jgi:hypothetical protein